MPKIRVHLNKSSFVFCDILRFKITLKGLHHFLVHFRAHSKKGLASKSQINLGNRNWAASMGSFTWFENIYRHLLRIGFSSWVANHEELDFNVNFV